jgi:hypothetical protein
MDETTLMRDVIQAMIDKVPDSDTKAEEIGELTSARREVRRMTLSDFCWDVEEVVKHSELPPMLWVYIRTFVRGIQEEGTCLAGMMRCCHPRWY